MNCSDKLRDYLDMKYPLSMRIDVAILYSELQVDQEERYLLSQYINIYHNNYSLDRDIFIEIVVDICDNGYDKIRQLIVVPDITEEVDDTPDVQEDDRSYKYKLYAKDKPTVYYKSLQELAETIGRSYGYLSNTLCNKDGRFGGIYQIERI